MQSQSSNDQSAGNPDSHFDADYEFLILSMGDLVQLVCRECGSKYSVVRSKALQCLHAIIVHFSRLPDPDAGIEGECLLNQFRAQIQPAIRSIISTESDPSIRAFSAELAVDFTNCPLATVDAVHKNVHSLFLIFEKDPNNKNFPHMIGVYEQHVRTIIILQHLRAICTLYNRVYFPEIEGLNSSLMMISVGSKNRKVSAL